MPLVALCESLRPPGYALPRPPPEYQQCSLVSSASCDPEPVRLPERCRQNSIRQPEMRQLLPHLLHSAPPAKRLPAGPPREPVLSTDTGARKPWRSPISLDASNRDAFHWRRRDRDRLAHIELAGAYPSGQAAPGLNRPQTPPSNESWTGDESPRQFASMECRKASAPQ